MFKINLNNRIFELEKIKKATPMVQLYKLIFNLNF